jgi:uncharacterized repeat protein (TIGR01451 family)
MDPSGVRITFQAEGLLVQHLRFFCASLAALAVSTAIVAEAKPVVQLKLQGAVVERDAAGTGEKLVPLAEAELRPGETIRYDIVATNAGSDSANRLIPTSRVPAGTEYEAGSASLSGAVRIEFSLDGGKTWAAKPLVSVKTASGAVVERPADPSQFTMLRWISEKALGPKQSVTYTYEVRIK